MRYNRVTQFPENLARILLTGMWKRALCRPIFDEGGMLYKHKPSLRCDNKIWKSRAIAVGANRDKAGWTGRQ